MLGQTKEDVVDAPTSGTRWQAVLPARWDSRYSAAVHLSTACRRGWLIRGVTRGLDGLGTRSPSG